MLKETGARTIEAARLRWCDIDSSNRIVAVSDPAKGGKPRSIRVSERCITMVKRQPRSTEFVFGENARERMRHNFHWARKHVSAKTANKEFLKIHLHSFRHFFATRLYQRTRDIRYVQKKLGHRSITSTVIYENSDACEEVVQYTIKAVSSKDEATKLGELGYEPFDELDGVKLYRRKCIGFD